MYGASYFGFTLWAAAIKQPPALKAMVPYITWSDPFNGLALRGGALELGTPAHWGLIMGIEGLVRRLHADLPALRKAMLALCREIDTLGATGYASLPLGEFGPLRRHPVLPSFFDRIAASMDAGLLYPVTIAGKHDQVTVPTFN